MKAKKSLLSKQIKNDLLNLINSAGYKGSERLPCETELATSLNVSRSTLRNSLFELESEGIIERIKGAGTFLKKTRPLIKIRLNNLFKLSDLMKGTAYSLKTTSIKIENARANDHIASILAIKKNEEIIIFERVRSLNDIPAVYSIDRVPKSLLPPQYTLEDIGNSLSGFLGVHIASSKAKIAPVKATNKLCEALQVPPNTLCLGLEEITYDSKDLCIDYSHEYYLNHLFVFEFERTKSD